MEDSALRGALAQAIGSTVYAEGVVWRVNRSEYLTPSPEPSPHRLVARIPAWEGAEIEVVACCHELELPFSDAERRLLAAIMPHLARAARLGSWGLDGAVCMASTAAYV